MTHKMDEFPPECKTEAEKTAFAFGWWKAMEAMREKEQDEPVACDGNFPDGFNSSFGISAQALRAANSALCDMTGNRQWDVPCLAKHILNFNEKK